MVKFLGFVVVALAIGCGTEPETSETSQAVKSCDDPTTCARGNGGGVYTQEMGNAGLGPDNFMITHFIRQNGVGVSVQGRGFDPNSGNYVVGNAEIVFARLDAAVGTLPAGDYRIDDVTETLTNPTFTLAGGDNGAGGTVTGLDLLHLSIGLKLAGGYATISFAGHSIDQRTTSGTQNLVTLQLFDMRWNDGLNLATKTQSYCSLAPPVDSEPGVLGVDDTAVFQQGIIVNPLNGVLNQNNDIVTLSCRHGGIATVRWWGYVYRGTPAQANLFETAIHMKRASYCGDERFFTRRNTEFFIRDSVGINNDNDDTGNPAITITPVDSDTDFEASWGRDSVTGTFRALCVNMVDRRHPHAKWPPPLWGGGGTAFTGYCPNDNTWIPRNNCPLPPTNPNLNWWIADQKSP